ncbi:hypothetical protein JL100_023840 [Skermanella mucosa]|uniref:hypothetical protein n=1 Tax=Skermanella mucosa TaxID=1789672 RepID=UPI00192AF1AF|nr:hypothetical protein [Skermanella mucosa]UEM20079.1 hypothetical protein JL100_023840 [Skermanella mucosa]
MRIVDRCWGCGPTHRSGWPGRVNLIGYRSRPIRPHEAAAVEAGEAALSGARELDCDFTPQAAVSSPIKVGR